MGCTCAATIAGLAVKSKLLEPFVFGDNKRQSKVASSKSEGTPQPRRSFSRKAAPDSADAIVIGSGAGGLACAVTLAKQGKRVLVLEQHDVLGGCTHTFTQDGYEFDSGLHYVGGEIWDTQKGGRCLMDFITDGAVQWHKTGDICDVSYIGGERMEIRAGREQLREDLKARFPGESAVVDKYFAAVDASQGTAGLYFAHKICPAWIQPILDKLLRHRFISKWASKTTLEVLRSIGASNALIGRLTFMWGDYGLPPGSSSFSMHAMVAAHYVEGGAYPVGGPSVIALEACRVLERHGGSVLCRAPVEELLVNERGQACGVRVAKHGGVDIRAPIVVSAAGAVTTYTKLVPERLRPPEVLSQIERNAIVPSCAHLSLFVGLKGSVEELQLPASNTWISPTAEHDANTKAWYSLEPTEEVLDEAEFAAVFITFPSAKDPSWPERHPGKSTCHLIAEAPYRWFQKWQTARLHHRGDAYLALKRLFTRKLLAVLLERFPQCEGRIDVCELGTPLTSEHYLGSAEGSSYGVASTPERFAAEWLQPRTSVPGLFLAGQDVVSMGVMGALVGGFLTALTIDRRILWSQLRIVTSL